MSDGWGEEQYRELRIWKYAHIAAYVVLVWDWIICLEDEVEWIWTRKRTLFTALCMVVRYVPLPMYTIALVSTFQSEWSPRTCESIAALPTLFVCFAMLSAHTVFLIRTWALYGRSRTVLLTLCCALALDAAFLFASLIDQRVSVPPPGHGCLPGAPRLVFGILTWVAPLIFDTLIFAFTLWKTLWFVREHGSDASLFVVFLRDGVVYYAVIFVCYLTTILIYVLAPPALKDLNAGFSVVLTLVMTERLLLHLRMAVQKPDNMPADMLSVEPGPGMTLAERARVHMSTLVAEMEAGVPRGRGTREDSDEESSSTADDFDSEVQTYHSADEREPMELQNVRRARTF